ncbi:DUF2325 domain-containing protein [Pseudoduganella sp. RAF19]|uniref:DUF2325 domain-containing protein n=1 Tax=Pseudoduganella sp. RAF19 TaxID=3233052 RepID=UPI003F98FFE7
MCDQHEALLPAAPAPRRRRIWELGHNCLCPLVGVGLPLPVLRKVVGKAAGGTPIASDYEIHVGTVSECGSRNRLSEAVQKELERRYAVTLQRFRSAKDSTALEALWHKAVSSGDVSGAFFAGLTHPHCTQALEELMCRDLHMIQHQAGAVARADIQRLNGLATDNAVLTRELARLQQRSAAAQQERTAEQERHNVAMMQLRAQLIGRDSIISSLRQELEELRASIPGLATRERLARQLELAEERERSQRQQIADLRRALSEAENVRAEDTPTCHAAPGSDSAPGRALAASHRLPGDAAAATEPGGDARQAVLHGRLAERQVVLHGRLAERHVLCVGGRSGNVASYRALLEQAGARFSHHDGGLEHNANQLESSLASADLVICQTGCISHAAYWRVKDYCKRHGKRCVFVDKPSLSTLQLKLEELAQ